MLSKDLYLCVFFFQAEDGIRDGTVTGVQTCALPICASTALPPRIGRAIGSSRTRGWSKIWCAARWIATRRAVALGRSGFMSGRSCPNRSEERRVGKECRSRWAPDHEKKKKKDRRG